MLTFQTGVRDASRLRFSSTGRFLAICDGDTVDGEGYEVWSVPPGHEPVHHDGDVVLRGGEWHPVADELCVPRDDTLKVVTPHGKTVQTVKDAGWVRSVAFAPAGDRLFTLNPFLLTGWKRVRGKWRSQWSAEVKKTGPLKNDSFESVTVFPDGERLLILITRSILVPNHVRGKNVPYHDFQTHFVLRDTGTGQVLGEQLLAEEDRRLDVYPRLAITSDGAQIIGFLARSVVAFPTDPGKKVRRTPVSKKDVRDVALHPSGRWVLVANGSSEVSVWDTTTWKLVRTFNWKIGAVECADISADGLLAAVAGAKGKVAVWDWDV